MIKTEKSLYIYNVFVAAATFFLILAGGLVTSNQAGLSVPDWPLSYGQVFPPMQGLMIWEHSHRLIAGSIGILSLILVFWITLADKRKWLIGIAWFSLGLVLLQALLGGLTVLMKLPHTVSIAHAVLGQTFMGFVLCLAFFESPYCSASCEPAAQRDPKQVRLALSCAVFVYIQLVLGAIVRHTGRATIEHIVFALLVAGHILAFTFYALYRHPEQKSLIRLVIYATIALVAQIFLGIGAYSLKTLIPAAQSPTAAKVVFTALHQTCGAAILGLILLAVLVSFFPEKIKK